MSSESVPPETAEGTGGAGLLRVWAVSTLVLFCLCALWSIATPIGANNDEGAQLIKAASVVRGQIVGQSVNPASLAGLSRADRFGLDDCATLHGATNCDRAVTVVSVPESIADLTMPVCVLLEEHGSPCGRNQRGIGGLRGSGRDVSATTYVGRYPPLYYAIVGLPSLVWHTSVAVYLMRLLSGLLTALMVGLALALSSVWSRSRLLVLTVAVAATPTVLIFGSAVNPSGLEMAASLCVWTGGLILVLDHTEHPPPSLVYGTAAAAIVMVLTRGLSPFWLALIGVSLVALAPRSLPELFRCRAVRISGAAVAVAAVAAVGYIAWAHTLSVYPLGLPVPSSMSSTDVLELALGRIKTLAIEFIGTFDSAESAPPLVTIGLWILVAAGLLVFGLVASLRRHAAVIVGLIAASLIIPTVVMVSQARHVGLVWQARDGFPLYVGILLVAGAAGGRSLGSSRVLFTGSSTIRAAFGRLAVLVAVAVALAQLADVIWALRLYAGGFGATFHPRWWDPPVPAVLLIVIAVLASAFYGWWIIHLSTAKLVPAAAPPPLRPATPPPRTEEHRDSDNGGAVLRASDR
jgi:Predicted membrane protein (DUF2142)